jgi:hypothetical protein
VTIQPPGDGKLQSVSTDDLKPGDVPHQSYKVAKSGGGTRPVVVDDGVSLMKVLAATGTDFNYATIGIPRPNGSVLTLTKAQVDDNPRVQPVFFMNEQNVPSFIWPVKSSNGVVAAKYSFAVSQAVVLVQQSEPKLRVTISPSEKKIKPGEEITFHADVEGDEGGGSVTYTWGIKGKKQTVGGPTFTQPFPKKDAVYRFLVAVRIEGSKSSVTKVAIITVGDPEKAKEQQPGDQAPPPPTYTPSDGPPSGTPSYEPVPTTPPTPTPEPADPPDIATSGTTVEGNLLADASDPPPSNILESAAQAAREGKQKDDKASDGDVGVSEAAVSVFAALALLALGAGIETRQGRLPRLRLPRRAA